MKCIDYFKPQITLRYEENRKNQLFVSRMKGKPDIPSAKTLGDNLTSWIIFINNQ